MASNRDLIDAWTRRVFDPDAPVPSDRSSNLDLTRDTIYSYGRHFPMATAMRDTSGGVAFFLLNGDRYSPTTDRHQSLVRNSLHGYEKIIVPFSTLDAAGIDKATIQPLEITRDRWIDVERTAFTRPDGWTSSDDGQYRTYAGEPIVEETTDDGRTRYRWTAREHVLGESVFRAKVLASSDWRANVTGRYRWADFLSAFDTQERGSDGRGLYFLCELPRGWRKDHPATVDGAREALKPEAVKLAERAGRKISRQGDIFAIELSTETTTRSLRAAGAVFEKRNNPMGLAPGARARLLGTNHVATEVARLPGRNGVTLARGTLYHVPSGRDADHKRVTIGKRWHVIVKNTVPLTRKGK